MPSHYIFEDLDRSQLRQGDVLKRTPELEALLERYHRHYALKPTYPYFIVLTQTCDLVPRDGGSPKAAYVTIAAVRPLEIAIRKEAEIYQSDWQIECGVIDTKMYDALHLFMERLLNNNEPRYFYLHEDSTVKLTPRCCAFLALSVALKIEHLDICLAAKMAQLEGSFRAKLGWLAANMYGRVGTKEWDEHYGKGSWEKLAKDLLQNKSMFVRFSAEKIAAGLRELQAIKPLEEYSTEEIVAGVRRAKVVRKADKFDEHARRALQAEKFVDKICGNLRRQIAEDPNVRELVREYLHTEHGLTDEQLDKASQQILGAIPRVLDKSLRDEFFPAKDAIVERIVSAIRTDSAVAQLLT